MDVDDLIGSAEARKILQVDKSTLSRWVAAGTVTPIKRFAGRTGAMIFRRGDIEKLAAVRAAQHG